MTLRVADIVHREDGFIERGVLDQIDGSTVFCLISLNRIRRNGHVDRSGAERIGNLRDRFRPSYAISDSNDINGITEFARATDRDLWLLQHQIAAKAFGLEISFWSASEGDTPGTHDFFVTTTETLERVLDNPADENLDLESLIEQLQVFEQATTLFYPRSEGCF